MASLVVSHERRVNTLEDRISFVVIIWNEALKTEAAGVRTFWKSQSPDRPKPAGENTTERERVKKRRQGEEVQENVTMTPGDGSVAAEVAAAAAVPAPVDTGTLPAPHTPLTAPGTPQPPEPAAAPKAPAVKHPAGGGLRSVMCQSFFGMLLDQMGPSHAEHAAVKYLKDLSLAGWDNVLTRASPAHPESRNGKPWVWRFMRSEMKFLGLTQILNGAKNDSIFVSEFVKKVLD